MASKRKPKPAKRVKLPDIKALYVPDDTERVQLLQVLEMPGWDVIQKIAVASVAEFREVVFKLNRFAPTYEAMLLEAARSADIAATLWEGIARRIETEWQQASQPAPKGSAPTPEEALDDVTSDLE